jgi:hypothetical protein
MRTLLPVLVALTLFISCAGDKKDPSGKEPTSLKDSAVNKTDPGEKEELSLIGRWKPVEMNIKGISEEEKKELKSNITLEFSRDGRYIGQNKESTQEGTYSYDPATKKLSVTSNTKSGDKEIFTVGWEDDLLLMTNDEGTVKLKRQ